MNARISALNAFRRLHLGHLSRPRDQHQLRSADAGSGMVYPFLPREIGAVSPDRSVSPWRREGALFGARTPRSGRT